MTVLSALNSAYERMSARGEVPSPGYSNEKIGFLISLKEDGTPASAIDWRDTSGKKKTPRPMLVPQPTKRTSGISPNTLWDKTSYVLGVTAGEGRRTADEHAAFVKHHRTLLADASDPGLVALRRFLEKWQPEDFETLDWPEDMKDQNVAFTLESDRLSKVNIHDRPAAKELWAYHSSAGERAQAMCLVTGERGPVARLHPAIKGVWGAQSSGASIVSFNLDAFTSYGHEQGDNAPVSEAAAFAYTTVLNKFLERDSGHRLQIGDASVVFWADGSGAEVAEGMFLATFEGFDDEINEHSEASKVGSILKRLRAGERLESFDPGLAKDVRFYVLGLAPNAARLSIRFWLEDNFGCVADNFRAYLQDIELKPAPPNAPMASIRRLALRTAPASREGKSRRLKFDTDRISPLLAGELLRAILTGQRFPSSLLSLLLMRVRSDGILDHMRAALIKAIIVRSMRLDGRLLQHSDDTPKEDYLMRSDPNDPNPARRLGRLFAVIERAQLAALGDKLNATVADKFLGAASATPSRVMPNLIRNAREHHIKRLRNGHSDAEWIKDAQHARRVAAGLDRDIGLLISNFTDGFSVQFSPEEQGLFLIGYYQERYGAKGTAADDETINDDDTHSTADKD